MPLSAIQSMLSTPHLPCNRPWPIGRPGTMFPCACAAGALPAGTPIDEFREGVERDVRYANIAIIEGNEASQFGIGIVSARIAEAVLRNERAVLPIGAYNAEYGVTLSLPSVVGWEGVSRILEPAMSVEERRALGESV